MCGDAQIIEWTNYTDWMYKREGPNEWFSFWQMRGENLHAATQFRADISLTENKT